MKFLQKLTRLHLWLKLFSVLCQCTWTTFSTSVLQSCTCPYLEMLPVSPEGLASNPASCRNICNSCKLCWTVFHIGEKAKAGTDNLIGHHRFYRSDIWGNFYLLGLSTYLLRPWSTGIQMLSAGGWSQKQIFSNLLSISSFFTYIKEVDISLQDQISCLEGTISFYFF